MAHRVVPTLGAVLIAAIFAPGPVCGILPSSPHVSAPPSASTATTAAATSATPSVAPAAPNGPSSTSPLASDGSGSSAIAASALAATRAAGLKSNVVFVPRPSATPAQRAAAEANGTVTPLYDGTPAPIGLAYYGLSEGSNGAVVGTVLNTTSVRGTVDFNGTGVQAMDLFQSSPDAYGIQLNSVLTNVTLFGTPGYEFWTQNVVLFYPDAGFLILVTNIWNFSAPGAAMSANALYSHGPYGTNESGELGYYYAELPISIPETYPFDLTLFLNSTLVDGRDAVAFTVVVQSTSDPAEDFALPYDTDVFNSTAPGGPSLLAPSNYTANGFAYDPQGLTNDFELTIGGPGGGSQATLSAADASLGLAYWTGAAYQSVPAAYSYGGETGETAVGANVAWSDAYAGRPSPDLYTYGTMTTGPTILTGLWNASGPEGSYRVTLDVSPANAFNFLAPANGWSPAFTVNELALAPEMETETLYLTPGQYTLETELSEYAPVTSLLNVVGPSVVRINLQPNPAYGIYTPLWAFSNGEIASLAISGNGTAASPYIIENNQYGPIASPFGLYNDYDFPAYPAVFFANTNATTEFLDPPSFATATDTFQFPGAYLPATNDLQYWFWNASNVAVVGAANISGWFGLETYYPISFDTFNMIFYEGGHDLVAANQFSSEGQALLVFAGGGIFAPPINIGGQNVTVWGNVFAQASPPPRPSSCYGNSSSLDCLLLPYGAGLGLELAASNDTVYNNAFLTPTTAWLLPLNLYSGNPYFYADAFNITPQPASAVHYAAGFPFVSLTGSILGTADQGGNYWWDYGLGLNPYNGADNPYDVLPYEERAATPILEVYGPAYYYQSYIYPGGDYAPLTNATVFPVTVRETGLPSGVPWQVEVVAYSTVFALVTTELASTTFELPNGSYALYISTAQGWAGGSSTHSFVVRGGSLSLRASFHLHAGYHLLTFDEKGLAKGTEWAVTLNASNPNDFGLNETENSTGTSIHFAVVGGTYNYSASIPSGYTLSPANGTVTARSGSATSVRLVYHRLTGSVTFELSGLPAGTVWSVTLGGRTVSSKGTSITIAAGDAQLAYVVRVPSGYVASPNEGSLFVSGSETVEISAGAR